MNSRIKYRKKYQPFPPLHHNLYKSGHAREQLKTKI